MTPSDLSLLSAVGKELYRLEQLLLEMTAMRKANELNKQEAYDWMTRSSRRRAATQRDGRGAAEEYSRR